MNVLNENNLSLKLFLDIMSEDQEHPLSSPEAWHKAEQFYGGDVYKEVLHVMTQMEFEEEEARDHWFNILNHRRKLSGKLGRDAGFQVAACDYFTNIDPMLKDLVFVNVHTLIQKERIALVDDLTGLHNRRYFKQVIEKEIENSRRFGEPFSILILDLDKFKEYNDAFGHPAGDRALRDLANIIKANSRTIDHTVRYGGEEFIIVLPRCNKKSAVMAADRYRKYVDEHYFEGEERLRSGNLTATIGVATFPDDADAGDTLLKKADEALYRGKEFRNIVIAHGWNNRIHHRYQLCLDLDLKDGESGKRGKTYKGRTMDISAGGTLCSVDHHIPSGRFVDVVLRSPETDRKLKMKAQVVRVNESLGESNRYHMGLSFKLHSARDQAALLEIINEKTAPLH